MACAEIASCPACVAEEVEAIAATFTEARISHSEDSVEISFDPPALVPWSMRFRFDSRYPEQPPVAVVAAPQLPPASRQAAQAAADEAAASAAGGECMFTMLSAAFDAFQATGCEEKALGAPGAAMPPAAAAAPSEVEWRLIHIDHMRSQQAYVKQLSRWALEYRVTGILYCRT